MDHDRHLLWRRSARLGGACALVVAAMAATSTTAVAQTDPAPQLSITVDDGETSAAVDDELTYSITVVNLGVGPVDGLIVTQTRPDGLAFGSADSAGVDGEGLVRWVVDVPADGQVAVHSTMTVTKTDAGLLRLATVACAAVADDQPALVCATDSDELPAGARAAAAVSSGDDSSSATPWLLGGGSTVVVVALVVLVLRRRRVVRAGSS
jgi:uncharacterized repeat protein (TIGR01451 family)